MTVAVMILGMASFMMVMMMPVTRQMKMIGAARQPPQ